MEATNHPHEQGKCFMFEKYLNQTTTKLVEPCPKSMLSGYNNPLESPTLNQWTCSIPQINEDNMNVITGENESINPDLEEMNGQKMDPNPFNLMLSLYQYTFKENTIQTSNKCRYNCKKNSGYGIIETSNLFLFNSYILTLSLWYLGPL